ncbi:unnamed protein product [Caenorhabditis brenneri]
MKLNAVPVSVVVFVLVAAAVAEGSKKSEISSNFQRIAGSISEHPYIAQLDESLTARLTACVNESTHDFLNKVNASMVTYLSNSLPSIKLPNIEKEVVKVLQPFGDLVDKTVPLLMKLEFSKLPGEALTALNSSFSAIIDLVRSFQSALPKSEMNKLLQLIPRLSQFLATLAEDIVTGSTRSVLTTGLTTGIPSGITTGLTAVLTTGLTTGIPSGITTGLTAVPTTGLTTGIPPGITTGLTAVLTTGLTTGIPPGITTGLTAVLTTGLTTGIPPGITTGLTAVLTTGLTTGIPPGITTGLTAVFTTGLTTGISLGITTGLTTGTTTRLITGFQVPS